MISNELGIFLIIVVVLLCVCLLLFLLIFTLSGAISLFAVAIAQGFIGGIAYVAAWVFMFPIMLIVCAILGFLRYLNSDE